MVCVVVCFGFLCWFCNWFIHTFVLTSFVQLCIYIIRSKIFIAVITSQRNAFQDFVLIGLFCIVSNGRHFGVFVPIHVGCFLYITCFLYGGFAHSTVTVNFYGFGFGIFDLSVAHSE